MYSMYATESVFADPYVHVVHVMIMIIAPVTLLFTSLLLFHFT